MMYKAIAKLKSKSQKLFDPSFKLRYLVLLSRIFNEEGDETSLRPRLLWVKLILISLLGSISLATLYAFISTIDEVAIIPGELKPSGNVSGVKAVASGVVEEIVIKDG